MVPSKVLRTVRLLMGVSRIGLKGRSVNLFTDEIHTLGTLGGRTADVEVTHVDATRENGLAIRKVKHALTSVTGKTAGDGPLLYGLSVNLTAAEVAECIDADPQQHEDPGSQEQSNQKVYFISAITQEMSALSATPDEPTRFRTLRDFPSWHVQEGQNLSSWVFNLKSSALTTGTIIKSSYWINGTWLRD